MWRRIDLLITDVSEELAASIIEVTTIDELGTLAVTSNVIPSPPILVTLMMGAIVPPKHRFLQELHDVTSQETAFFSHCRENLKSYITLTGWTL
jgi:hypothetical protein